MVTSQRSCQAVLLYYGHFSISYILVNHIQLKSSVHVHSTYRYIFLILKLQHSLIHILLDVCRWKSEAFGWLWVLQMDRLLQLLFVYGRPSGSAGSAGSAFCFPYNSVTVRRILFKFGRFRQ